LRCATGALLTKGNKFLMLCNRWRCRVYHC